MPKAKNLVTISVAETAPKKFKVTATFKDAPPITVDTANPRASLTTVALQAAIYLIMREQGKDTSSHVPVPRSLMKKMEKML